MNLKNPSIKKAVQILDVRTPGEYAGGHIKNTLLANWNDKEEFNRRISFIDKTNPCMCTVLPEAEVPQLRKK